MLKRPATTITLTPEDYLDLGDTLNEKEKLSHPQDRDSFSHLYKERTLQMRNERVGLGNEGRFGN